MGPKSNFETEAKLRSKKLNCRSFLWLETSGDNLYLSPLLEAVMPSPLKQVARAECLEQ